MGPDIRMRSPLDPIYASDVQPFSDALTLVRELVLELRAAGHRIDLVDVGGGLGVTYSEERPPTPQRYAAAVHDQTGSYAGAFVTFAALNVAVVLALCFLRRER